MKMITMNEGAMIWGEASRGRILMKMKAMAAAVYLCRTDVAPPPCPTPPPDLCVRRRRALSVVAQAVSPSFGRVPQRDISQDN